MLGVIRSANPSCPIERYRILSNDNITINNKAKVRRSTKLGVLGTAKVLSCEDLEEARAKRAEKDAAKGASISEAPETRRAPVARMWCGGCG